MTQDRDDISLSLFCGRKNLSDSLKERGIAYTTKHSTNVQQNQKLEFFSGNPAYLEISEYTKECYEKTKGSEDFNLESVIWQEIHEGQESKI
jgi:hypothetical protein